MNAIYIYLLALIQGLSEFLPISSSGHLAVVQDFLLKNISSQEKLILDVFLHGGTLLAMLLYFRKDIYVLTKGSIQSLRNKTINKELKIALYITLATIITGIGGILLEHRIETMITNISFIAILFIINGINLVIASKITKPTEDDLSRIGIIKTIIITIAQLFALLPGISRSGSTISAALYSKVKPQQAFQFSFYIAIPAILGANILKIYEVIHKHIAMSIALSTIIIAVIIAFISGYLAIILLKRFTEKLNLIPFGIYTILLGIIILIIK